ncbi:hypothetical protein DHW03_13235 [Pedobacter yonginense]|uniref:Uncharacterized protein n=1 Tax=Pedobacter yonginense TaxID=651869 RepID=A0A317ELD8_9SPHI|nr:hypothetical protein DHW03_13235 [Pedobacter yonginense]
MNDIVPKIYGYLRPNLLMPIFATLNGWGVGGVTMIVNFIRSVRFFCLGQTGFFLFLDKKKQKSRLAKLCCKSSINLFTQS